MESINSVVESVGENVEEVKEGDLVLTVFSANCGECRDCKSTKSNNCSNFIEHKYQQVMPRDGTSRFRDKNGELLHHFLGVSSFTEYTVVDVSCVVKINREIPVDKACLLSCGVSTDNHIHVAEGARLCKASKIIGVDLNPENFELGKIFGLTDFINPANCGDKTVSEVIKEMTDGGADYCFECIGLSSVMKDAFDSSRQGWGKTVILGVEMHGSPISLNCYDLLIGRSVCGSLFGGLRSKSDIPLLVHKYLNKELHLDEFITNEVRFQEINKAFELLEQGKGLRCIIWMDN
ncbi:hypothetical protein LWI29_025025 [Acer saccharum]|uniref:Alcohol dehydrogenase n=1 Tax=Acer saccharum TaxID=4024 RepID=A0AA39VE77_ACESA|nr:hypothetical protein LWI29_025025 [Acer saccharum]